MLVALKCLEGLTKTDIFFGHLYVCNLWKLIGRSLFVVGIILIILGITFTLQSKSLVGPSSSFMYSNPSWTVNGFIVIAVGIAIFVSGMILWRF